MILKKNFLLALILVGTGAGTRAATVVETDLCVYGGTAAGVAAAVQAARLGKSVVLAESSRHLGGLTSGGLGATDIGNKAAIGGLAREFYQRVAQHYRQPEAWHAETPEAYFAQRGGRSGREEMLKADGTMWTFEPHVAKNILTAMLEEARVPVYFEARLAKVKKRRGRLTELVMDNGRIYRAKMFIDATYEGDLMARAGVRFTVGREANAQYHETLNAVRAVTPQHQFIVPVDPYRIPGDPASGLLPFIQAGDGGQPGAGDRAVQAYNFRLCYTRNPTNRLPHIKPAHYDPAQYELLARYLEALVASGRDVVLDQHLWLLTWMPNGKTDINNRGGFSTDFIGGNYDYPNADYATRARIWQAHAEYTQGFLYFLATSPRVPAHIRAELQQWGTARDEFKEQGGWPPQLYVREARRMVSDYVMTEHHCRGLITAEDGVGLAAYGMDSHNCQRIVKNGRVENEGDVQVHGFSPYPIAYRALVPRAGECANLFVPVCLSATHIAFGSIRMEPVFMILAQSAAIAAGLALEDNVPVQKVPYPKLRARLLAAGQVLEWTGPKRVLPLPKALSGITVDDAAARQTGVWVASSHMEWTQLGTGYLHDGNTNKGRATLVFTPDVPLTGNYEVQLLYPANPNRARNVPVTVAVFGGQTQTIQVNQRGPAGTAAVSLGTFQLPQGRATTITVANQDTDGYVVADGVFLRPVK